MNYALKFTGEKDSGVIIPYSQLLAPVDSMTLEAMVYINESHITTTRVQMIASKAHAGGFNFYLKDGYLYCDIYIEGAYQNVKASSSYFILNKYNHTAVVFDGRYTKLYINGVLSGSNDSGRIYKISYRYDNAFTIGNDPGNANNFDPNVDYGFNGSIDEVRYWNVAKDSNYIKKSAYIDLEGNENGLIGYWKMNESSGDILYDSTSNNNNGDIYKATWVESYKKPIFLIKQSDNFYSIKPECYEGGAFKPITLSSGDYPIKADFDKSGFDDLNDLLKERSEGRLTSQSTSLDSGKMFSFDFGSDFKSIINIE